MFLVKNKYKKNWTKKINTYYLLHKNYIKYIKTIN